MSRWKAATGLVFASTLLITGNARAWGPEGHAIVAEIAEARLTSAAKNQVSQLLAGDDSHATHLDQIASWADSVRPSRPESAPWHFVDTPLDQPQYDANRDCAGDNCVVQAIQKFVAVLRDRNAKPGDRLEALKFVVHFVGDIHQPLHCETDLSKFPPPEGDRGGNNVHVSFLGHPTNLHSVWDGRIIEDVLQVELGPHFQPDLQATAAEARKLNAAILASNAAAWAPDGLVDHLDTATVEWANNSHRAAQDAYRNLPTHRTRGWEQAYEDAEWPVIEGQLQRAGVRLAQILNEALQ